jgi:hypothetical protein
MRLAFGLRSVRFRNHESYAELEEFLRNLPQRLWIGETAGVYASFWSAVVQDEYSSLATGIGIILEQLNAVPQAVVAPDGSLLVIGFNKCVAFIHGWPLTATENVLDAPFFNFIASNTTLVAIHELGCIAFYTSTFNRLWEVHTDIVQNASLDGAVLVLNTSDGAVHRIDLLTGEDEVG